MTPHDIAITASRYTWCFHAQVALVFSLGYLIGGWRSENPKRMQVCAISGIFIIATAIPEMFYGADQIPLPLPLLPIVVVAVGWLIMISVSMYYDGIQNLIMAGHRGSPRYPVMYFVDAAIIILSIVWTYRRFDWFVMCG